MHEKMQNNTLVIMDATGHCPHMSAPDETIKAMKAYLV
jgi:sigma-B regulation protein RsbQ